MKKFQIIIDITDENFGENAILNESLWKDFLWNDYTNMELIDCETGTLVLFGDTTHNDIWNKINDFLEGVKYAIDDIKVTKAFRNGNKIIEIED